MLIEIFQHVDNIYAYIIYYIYYILYIICIYCIPTIHIYIYIYISIHIINCGISFYFIVILFYRNPFIPSRNLYEVLTYNHMAPMPLEAECI